MEFLRECFVYAPQTGELRWRERPETHFVGAGRARYWNRRFAGKVAGADMHGAYLVVQVRYLGEDRLLRVHRVAYAMHTGADPGELDHCNRNGKDNRFVNLRPATPLQNSFNRRKPAGKNLPKGVTKDRSRYVASTSSGGKMKYLGRFGTAEEAHAAYCAYAHRNYGEFFCPD